MGRTPVIGYSFGAWDLLHAGHANQLRAARELCDYLIVGVFTDEVIAGFKRVPIITYEYRAVLVGALNCVDEIMQQTSRDPSENLKIVYPDILFHGDDWDEIPGEEYMKSIGGRVVTPPYFEGVSTSRIIQTIMERYCE